MNNWDSRFLLQAALNASWSKDPSTKCGAVIVSERKTIVGQGFNGFPRRVADNQRLFNRDVKYYIIVHAEVNALLNASSPVLGCSIYTWPFPPCCRCSSFIIQAGIKRVYAPVPSKELWERWKIDLTHSAQILGEAGVEMILFRVGELTPIMEGLQKLINEVTKTKANLEEIKDEI